MSFVQNNVSTLHAEAGFQTYMGKCMCKWLLCDHFFSRFILHFQKCWLSASWLVRRVPPTSEKKNTWSDCLNLLLLCKISHMACWQLNMCLLDGSNLNVVMLKIANKTQYMKNNNRLRTFKQHWLDLCLSIHELTNKCIHHFQIYCLSEVD